MWDKFTERAKQAVYFAQTQAEALDDNYVATEHLLLGVIADSEALACRILLRVGVSPNELWTEIEQHLTKGPGRLLNEMALTWRSKRAIDLAFEEARYLGDDHIGTEHLLLGLVLQAEDSRSGLNRLFLGQRGDAGVAAFIIAHFGVRAESLRTALRHLRGDLLLRSAAPAEAPESLLRPASSPSVDSDDSLLRPTSDETECSERHLPERRSTATQ